MGRTERSLLGRPASTVRLLALLMAAQTFIHGTLTALAGHRGDPPWSRRRPLRHLWRVMGNAAPGGV